MATTRNKTPAWPTGTDLLLRVEFVDEYQPDPTREARMIVVLPNGQRTTVSREDLVEAADA